MLVILVDVDSSRISDVLEGAIQTLLGCDEGHEILNRSQRTGGDVESVIPEGISGGLVVLLVLDALLLLLGRALHLGLLAGVPEVGVHGGEEDQSQGSAELSGLVITGPSLRAAR